VGRTARAGREGRALLFLLPEELGFLKYLKHAKVTLNEYEFPSNKIANVQSQLEKLIEKNYYLHRSAREAYRSYLLAYASHSHKEIFDVHSLDLTRVVKAFGFDNPPKVNFNIAESAKQMRKKGSSLKGPSGRQKTIFSKAKGHSFSASNPRGKRANGDTRQFVH